MERPSWAPAGIEVDRPSIARVYDYMLGGFHNFTADRELVDRIRELMPEVPLVARANRRFMTRAVQYCLSVGVRQFLDLGSGIPTAGNVHEVTRADPGARVIYVDVDPVAVAHSEAILRGDEQAAVIQADLREPKRILEDPELQRLIDLDQPVALLAVSVLHFIPDAEDPAGLIAGFGRPLAPGSHLILSHGTEDGPPRSQIPQVRQLYERTVADATARTRDEVLAMFGDFELVPPGLTWVAQWAAPGAADLPPAPEEVFGAYGGIGRKP
jgi:SAM-dependent methyltransferase